MSMKINDNIKVNGTLIVEENSIDPTTTSIYAMFYPSSRYPNGVGGQNHRILSYGGMVDGKPSYGYGDEKVLWNNAYSRWEMTNVYNGVISYSQQNVQYPWLVVGWYYGSNILDLLVFVNRN
jgi:hypothetical protein